ncbi:MAG: hypothetical protein OXL36_10980 [Bryobacterales bacterium]|nr:hypothetical protein [Bryobacterales bacterium]MDE0295918.1 hypothetical protein [Bryobacterales bacterium]
MDNFAFEGVQLIAAKWSNRRLIYATPEFQQDVHLSDVARLHVRVATESLAANLSVWLVSLPWTNSDNVIAKCWTYPTNAGACKISSARSVTDLMPVEFFDVELALQPEDQVIPAGACSGLMIFSSKTYFTVYTDSGTMLTVDLGAMSIKLPVVSGVQSLRRALPSVSERACAS